MFQNSRIWIGWGHLIGCLRGLRGISNLMRELLYLFLHYWLHFCMFIHGTLDPTRLVGSISHLCLIAWIHKLMVSLTAFHWLFNVVLVSSQRVSVSLLSQIWWSVWIVTSVVFIRIAIGSCGWSTRLNVNILRRWGRRLGTVSLAFQIRELLLVALFIKFCRTAPVVDVLSGYGLVNSCGGRGVEVPHAVVWIVFPKTLVISWWKT